jgi:hypothetical protein
VKRRQEKLLKEQPQGVKKNEALLKEGLVSIIGVFIVLFYLFSFCIYFLYFFSFALHLSFFDNHRIDNSNEKLSPLPTMLKALGAPSPLLALVQACQT